MTISPRNIDRILNNATLCESIRTLSCDHAADRVAAELRRTAAKRGITMTQAEAVGIVDAVCGDVTVLGVAAL